MWHFSRVDILTVREGKARVGDFGQSGGVTNLAMLRDVGLLGPVPFIVLTGDSCLEEGRGFSDGFRDGPVSVKETRIT